MNGDALAFAGSWAVVSVDWATGLVAVVTKSSYRRRPDGGNCPLVKGRTAPVPQTSQSAVSQASQPAGRSTRRRVRTSHGLRYGRSSPLAVTMQLGGKWLRSRFLRKARSAARAYPSWICKRPTTKSLRKKIEQTPPIQSHGCGLGRLCQRGSGGHKISGGGPASPQRSRRMLLICNNPRPRSRPAYSVWPIPKRLPIALPLGLPVNDKFLSQAFACK